MYLQMEPNEQRWLRELVQARIAQIQHEVAGTLDFGHTEHLERELEAALEVLRQLRETEFDVLA